MLKQTLAVVAAALFSAALIAQDARVRDDHPDRYVVQRGDTLWDISARFLNSPWLWPEVWQANPQIENPHLIYPGDVISLSYVDGQARIGIVRADEGISGPRIRTSPLEDAVPTVQLSNIRQYLERPRLLSREALDEAPYVVALEENRLLGMNTQVAYVRNLDVPVGTRMSINRPSLVYREVRERFWRQEPRERVADPWDMENTRRRSIGGTSHYLWTDWAYDRSGELLGYEVVEIGTAEVVKEGDPATVHISYVDQEIKRGDLLLPEQQQPFDLAFMPHPANPTPDGTRILALAGDSMAVGPSQVVVLNRGQADGVDNGTVFSVYHPGETIRDEVKAPRGDIRYTFGIGDDKVTLPAEFCGHVMVFRSFDRISYGLVMDAVKPIRVGDIGRDPELR